MFVQELNDQYHDRLKQVNVPSGSIQEALKQFATPAKKKSDVETLMAEIDLALQELENSVRNVESSFAYVTAPERGIPGGKSDQEVEEAGSPLVGDLRKILDKINRNRSILFNLTERSSVK
jgi:hypothetical protein